jgi:hypothetical protein
MKKKSDYKKIRKAVDTVIDYLEEEYITEGCSEGEHAIGCVSCEAVHVKRMLTGIRNWAYKE